MHCTRKCDAINIKQMTVMGHNINITLPFLTESKKKYLQVLFWSCWTRSESLNPLTNDKFTAFRLEYKKEKKYHHQYIVIQEKCVKGCYVIYKYYIHITNPIWTHLCEGKGLFPSQRRSEPLHRQEAVLLRNSNSSCLIWISSRHHTNMYLF